MVSIDITLSNEMIYEFSKLLNFTFNKESMPETYKTFKSAAIDIKNQWQSWAIGNGLNGIDSIKKPNSKLAQSINVRENSDFNFDIFTNSEYMKRIQDGLPEFDMKKTYPYSNKSRLGKTGPYLIIPFEWVSPSFGAHGQSRMTPKIYKAAGALAKSFVTGVTHFEDNAKGIPIERQEYVFKGRYSSDDINSKIDEYAQGMVTFDTSTKKKKSSSYFTFRVISVNSPASSWIRKSVKPIDVLNALKQNNENSIINNVENAIKIDIGINNN